MKFKTFKEKIIPVAMAVLTVFSVSAFGAGAEGSKKYLKDMPYPDIVSNIKEENIREYSFIEYDGNFYTPGINGTVECNNAMLLEYDAWQHTYKENALYPEYKITYKLNKEFTQFHSDIFTKNDISIDFEILGDSTRLIKRSISNQSEIVSVDLDVTNVENLMIIATSNFRYGSCSLMFNNAYLTKEGVPVEEPTERPTSVVPTEAPTEAPTSIATEAPTEKATVVPTETETVATEISTDVVKPTSATQQMPTAVPTSATQLATNVSGTSGNNGSNTSGGSSSISSGNAGSSGKVVNTGEEYFMFIVLGVLATGVLVGLFFVIKKKSVRR